MALSLEEAEHLRGPAWLDLPENFSFHDPGIIHHTQGRGIVKGSKVPTLEFARNTLCRPQLVYVTGMCCWTKVWVLSMPPRCSTGPAESAFDSSTRVCLHSQNTSFHPLATTRATLRSKGCGNTRPCPPGVFAVCHICRQGLVPQDNLPEARQTFFDEVRSCRRRVQRDWQKTGSFVASVALPHSFFAQSGPCPSDH